MKPIILSASLLLSVLCLSAQPFRKDTTAILILDRMSNIIGELNSCSFTLNTAADAIDPELGLITHFYQSTVYFSGPDKLLLHTRGDKGHRGFWYNGSQLAYYSFTEHNYATIVAPDNTIDMIDSVNQTYGIDFPAADFFYPTFTDDLISNFDEIVFSGKSQVGDILCYQIVARNPDTGVQIWVSDDEWSLPVKLVIVDYSQIPNSRYEATFTAWDINPDLPDSMFSFSIPPKARPITLVPKQ